ncbi:hypothetical protein [Sorangium sp. So ce117]|uniref:hypothetical protein n=1 Tax=Sorangium sp. So ce117 TaxID=3133277 RepID=UPI003F6016AB
MNSTLDSTLNSAPNIAPNGEPWKPGAPQPAASPPDETPATPATPGSPGSPGRTSPDREIQLPGTAQPGGDPGTRHQPEVPAPAHTQEIPAPPPHEVPGHDFPRARSGP